MRREIIILSVFCCSIGHAIAEVWQADLGNGKYKNPILMADYSDPDVCRIGEDFYMTSSSFNCVPALQILHSRDLVNWEITGAASPHHVPLYRSSRIVKYGNGVWAPSIRYQNNKFYIFYGDPDRGIVRLTADTITGPWEEKLIISAKGYIDPCPLWDEDGRVYLVHALAGSRAGLKSVILMAELDSTASEVVSPSRIIFDGHQSQPTCEGPKLYRRNGYYYIFMPAGGVRTGWQTVLRSKNIYGPYEEKIVLQQGTTDINGPHQGAWVDTPDGSDWFIHFQDRGVYGRVVHLQPMSWEDDWPVMGNKGEPVLTHRKPLQGEPVRIPQTSDEFDAATLGWQWQWMGSEQPSWYFCDAANSRLRLYSVPNQQTLSKEQNITAYTLSQQPQLLMQKLPAENIRVTTKVRFCPDNRFRGETAGMVITGNTFHAIQLVNDSNNILLVAIGDTITLPTGQDWIYLHAEIKYDKKNKEAFCQYGYSTDGKHRKKLGKAFQLIQQKDAWIGSKIGLFCMRPHKRNDYPPTEWNDGGWLDIDFFHIE